MERFGVVPCKLVFRSKYFSVNHFAPQYNYNVKLRENKMIKNTNLTAGFSWLKDHKK
jgi:hypothetical protein